MADLKNTWFNRTFRKKKIAEQDIDKKEAVVEQSISEIPGYQIPEEYQRMLQMYEQSAQALEKPKQLAGEATDIAKNRTGVMEAPGAAQAREDIRQSAATSSQNILEAGGGSMRGLGALAQTGLNEQMALRDLARQNASFRSQAEQDLMGALRSEAGMTADIVGQQAGMKAQGLGMMGQQKEAQYGYDMNKYLTGLQYQTTQLGNSQMELENIKNRRAQLWSSGLGALGGIGSALLGNPMGMAGLLGSGGSKQMDPTQTQTFQSATADYYKNKTVQ